jgi:hypothetical protein
MTHFRTGWAPASLIRQPIALPETLDSEVTAEAKIHHVSPNVYVGELLGKGVGRIDGCRFNPSGKQPGRRVQRIVALDRSVYSAINNQISNSDVEFSDLAAQIVRSVLHANGNGNGASNGHVTKTESSGH